MHHVGRLLLENGYMIENIDATIIAQKPKMRPHIGQMVKNIADTLGIEENQINVKATTEEGLGFTGSGEGISSQAVCLLSSIRDASYVVSDSEGGCQACRGHACEKAE